MAHPLHRNFSSPSFIAYPQNYPSPELEATLTSTTNNHDPLNPSLTQPEIQDTVPDTARASTPENETRPRVAVTFATDNIISSTLPLAQPETPRKRGLASRFKDKLRSLRPKSSKRPIISGPLEGTFSGDSSIPTNEVSKCQTLLTERNDQHCSKGLYIQESRPDLAEDSRLPPSIADMLVERGESSRSGAGGLRTHHTVDNRQNPEHGFSRQYKVIGAHGTDSSGSNPLVGKWQCCHCAETHALSEHAEGMHLVGVLSCTCPHRSCENCALTGNVKVYKPAQDPDMIPASEHNPKGVRFGVICGDCGMSWRAQVVRQSLSSRIAAIPKRLRSFEKLRPSKSMTNLHGEGEGRLRPVKSVFNLRALSNEMEKEHGEQAPVLMVKFNGIRCTCGKVLDDSCLCFQIVDTPSSRPAAEAEAELEESSCEKPSFMATEEDMARGIGKPMITAGRNGTRIPHFNPLMSNPVTDEELERLGFPRNPRPS